MANFFHKKKLEIFAILSYLSPHYYTYNIQFFLKRTHLRIQVQRLKISSGIDGLVGIALPRGWCTLITSCVVQFLWASSLWRRRLVGIYSVRMLRPRHVLTGSSGRHSSASDVTRLHGARCTRDLRQQRGSIRGLQLLPSDTERKLVWFSDTYDYSCARRIAAQCSALTDVRCIN